MDFVRAKKINTPLSQSHEEKDVEFFSRAVLHHKLSIKSVMGAKNTCILQCWIANELCRKNSPRTVPEVCSVQFSSFALTYLLCFN